jgi:hypothetical protein
LDKPFRNIDAGIVSRRTVGYKNKEKLLRMGVYMITHEDKCGDSTKARD